MRNILRLACLVGAVFFVSGLMTSASAAPIVIDYEGVVGNGQQSACPETPYTEDGFILTATPAALCNNYILNNVSGNNSFGNTTSVMGVCAGCSNPATMLTLAQQSGGSFDLTSVDLGSYFGSDPSVLTFTGYFALGGSITQLIDPAQLWATYNLVGFTALSSVEIQAISGQHYSIDNIVLNGNAAAVPEPGSLLLLGSGLFAVARRVRRRPAR